VKYFWLFGRQFSRGKKAKKKCLEGAEKPTEKLVTKASESWLTNYVSETRVCGPAVKSPVMFFVCFFVCLFFLTRLLFFDPRAPRLFQILPSQNAPLPLKKTQQSELSILRLAGKKSKMDRGNFASSLT